jgi:hypothetical protein
MAAIMRIVSSACRRFLIPTVYVITTTAFWPVKANAVDIESTSAVSSSFAALQQFKSSHSLADLKTAIAIMRASFKLSSFTSKTFISEKRALVWNWAQLLHVIEQSYDPTFNPDDRNDLPDVCVVPPVETNGTQLNCGVAPEDIKDPQARAKYIELLRANAAKAKRAFYYRDLSNIDEDARTTLEVKLELLRRVAPAGIPRDSQALEQILTKAGLNSAARKEIEPYLF